MRRIPSLRISACAIKANEAPATLQMVPSNTKRYSHFDFSLCMSLNTQESEHFNAPLSNGTFACRQRIFISVNIASLWCHWIAHIAPVVCLLRQVTSSNGCKILFACAPSPKRFLFWRLAPSQALVPNEGENVRISENKTTRNKSRLTITRFTATMARESADLF